jgi:hypothetical protein
MFVILGREGSGKSHTALRIAEAIDPTFTAERALFSPEPLLETLRDDEHKPGDVFVSDEAGVQLGNRTWQEKGQILVNQALQLIRNENLGLIFTLPRLSELDSQTQGRLHGYYQITKKVDGSHVKGRWRWLAPDRVDITGDIFHKKPKVQVGYEQVPVNTVSFTPPSSEIVDPYEERKEEFQKNFYDETISELSDDEEEEVDERSIADYAEQIKSEGGIAPYLAWHGGHNKWNISKPKLREAFDLSVRDSKRLKDRLAEDPEIDVQEAGKERRQPQ